MKKTLAKSLRSAVALLLALVLTVGSASAAFAAEIPANAEDRVNAKVQELADLLLEYGPDVVGKAGEYALDHGYVLEVKEYVSALKAELLAFAEAYGVEKAEIKNALEGPKAQLDQLKDYVEMLKALVALKEAGMTGPVDPENITEEQLEDLKEAGLTGDFDPSVLTDEQIEALKEAGLSGEFDPDLFTEEEIAQLEDIQGKLNETQDKIDAVEDKINALTDTLDKIEAKINEIVEAAKAAEDLSASIVSLLKEKSAVAANVAMEKYVEAREALFAALDNIYKPYTHLDELVGNVLDLSTAVCAETKDLALFVATDLKAAAAKVTKEDLVKAVGAIGLTLGVSEETMRKVADKLQEVVPPVVEKTKTLVVKLKNAAVKAFKDATSDDYCIDYASYYVAIGDAVAAADNSYVDLLADKLGVKYTKELTGYSLLQDVDVAANAAEIAKADIITVGFNATGLMASAFDAVVGEEVDWSFLPEAGQKAIAEVMGELAKYVDAMGFGAPAAEAVCRAIENVAYNSMVYAYELPNTIAEIRKYNEDAVVVIVGLDNPLEGVSLTHNAVSLNIDKAMDIILAASDAYSLCYAMLSGSCIFVAAPNAANDAHSTSIGAVQFAAMFLTGFESLIPNAKGQAQIKDAIYNALRISYGYKWGDANLDNKINYMDAVLMLRYAVQLIDENGLYLPVCDVNDDDKVNYMDAVLDLRYAVKLIDKFPVEQ